jgi:hypothetical protein
VSDITAASLWSSIGPHYITRLAGVNLSEKESLFNQNMSSVRECPSILFIYLPLGHTSIPALIQRLVLPSSGAKARKTPNAPQKTLSGTRSSQRRGNSALGIHPLRDADKSISSFRRHLRLRVENQLSVENGIDARVFLIHTRGLLPFACLSVWVGCLADVV